MSFILGCIIKLWDNSLKLITSKPHSYTNDKVDAISFSKSQTKIHEMKYVFRMVHFYLEAINFFTWLFSVSAGCWVLYVNKSDWITNISVIVDILTVGDCHSYLWKFLTINWFCFVLFPVSFPNDNLPRQSVLIRLTRIVRLLSSDLVNKYIYIYSNNRFLQSTFYTNEKIRI